MTDIVEPALMTGSSDPDSRPQGPALRGILLALAVFVFALTQFLPAVDDRESHRDEARWIHRAVYIRDLFTPLGEMWDEEAWIAQGGTMDEQYRLRAQPPLGSYIMGVGFLVQTGGLPDIGFWNMDHDNAWNSDAGNMPTRDELLAGRRTNAFVSALTAVAIFLTARRITNDLGGVIAGAFFALHPLAIYVATFAGSDAVLGLMIALAGIAAYRFADRPTWIRSLSLGVAIGLGGAAKLSPLGIAAALAALGALLLAAGLVWRVREFEKPTGHPATLPGHHRAGATEARWPWRFPVPEVTPVLRMAIGLLATPIVAGITFVASYPYLWRDPVGNAMNLLRYRTLGMELQSSLWSGIAVDSRTEALARIGDRLGSEMTVLGRFTSLGGQWPSVELAIGAAGLVLLTWLSTRRGIWSATALAAAVLVSITAITIYGLEADWARYHLPILILQATAIGVVTGVITGIVQARSVAPDGSPSR
jgi:hypothetical protein